MIEEDLRALLRDIRAWVQNTSQPFPVDTVRAIDAALAREPAQQAEPVAWLITSGKTAPPPMKTLSFEKWMPPKDKSTAYIPIDSQEPLYALPPDAAALIAERDAEIERLKGELDISRARHLKNAIEDAKNQERAEKAEAALAQALKVLNGIARAKPSEWGDEFGDDDFRPWAQSIALHAAAALSAETKEHVR